MTISSYLNFNGNCKEAIEFYSEIFNAVPTITTFGEMPPNEDYPVPDKMKKLIMHANLDVCDNQLMLSDVMPEMEFICGNNISLAISTNDKSQIKSWFDKLSIGGEIIMPLECVFWSELYGIVTDKFGIGWQFNYSEE